MTNVYFHCANEEHEFAAKRGVPIDNLVEACEHAHRIVRSYVMTASAEERTSAPRAKVNVTRLRSPRRLRVALAVRRHANCI